METDVKKKIASLESWTTRLSIRELYAEFGSPFWIVSKKQLTQNVNNYAAFTRSNARILFPVKTNPSLAILEVLAELGVGADCANRNEVDLALFAGIPYERIAYNGPVQDVCLSTNLLQKGAIVVMDDPDAVLEVQDRLKGRQFPGKLWLRVNPNVKIKYEKENENQELMSHASASSKFGIPAEEMVNFVKGLKMPVSGLHVHVGTMMDNLLSFHNSMAGMHALAQDLNAIGHPVKDLDVGGGLGIPFMEGDEFPSLEYWVEQMNPLRQKGYKYYVEPGHAIVGNAVSLLVTVESIKHSRNRRWIVTNVGTDQLVKVTLLRWPHRILGPDSKPLPKGGTDAIAGPLCFAGDVLMQETDAGGIEIGDPLLITHAGAYTFSLSNRFNGRLAPAWVLMDEDGFQKRMNSEGRYDNIFLTNYFYGLRQQTEEGEERVIPKQKIESLSSGYLKKLACQDEFEYLGMTKIGERTYEIDVMTESKVDFISMPFAIRIFGDAVIVTLLEHLGAEKKEVPIWGRKLNLDCFGQVKTGVPVRLRVSFSNLIKELNGTNTVIARFETECWNCSGNLVIKF